MLPCGSYNQHTKKERFHCFIVKLFQCEVYCFDISLSTKGQGFKDLAYRPNFIECSPVVHFYRKKCSGCYYSLYCIKFPVDIQIEVNNLSNWASATRIQMVAQLVEPRLIHRKVLGMIYPDCGFSRNFLVIWDKCRDSTYNLRPFNNLFTTTSLGLECLKTINKAKKIFNWPLG